MNKLHANQRPAIFVKGMESGIKRTRVEWAEALDMPLGSFDFMASKLRKKGYHYHPHSGNIRVGMKTRTGIVVDIMQNEEYLVSGLNRYEDNNSLPTLKGMFRTLEAAIQKYPRLLPEIQTHIDKIQTQTIEARSRMSSNN